MYRAVFEFRLTRRVDWAGDLAAFHEHVERVRRTIGGNAATRDVRVMTDVAASRLTLDFLVAAPDESAAEARAVATVSRAISDSGARYLGLAIRDGAVAPSRSPLSDLHTPIWQWQRIRIAKAA